MVGKVNGKLAAYNYIAQHYQDEVYTLAYYLTGREQEAAEAVQNAFTQVYQAKGLQPEYFRLDTLHLVVENCRKTGSRYPGSRYPYTPVSDEISRQLLLLNEDERCVLLLVDMLGLSYAETARVLGCSIKRVGQLLAQGRLRFAHKSTAPARLASV